MLFFEIRENKVHKVTKKVKNSITAGVVLAFIGIGYIGLNAFTDADIFSGKNGVKNERVEDKVVFASNWYALLETSEDDASLQIISSGTPIANPPTTGVGCAQNNTSGDYCAVHLNRPVDAPELPDNISVADALAAPFNYTLDTQEGGTDDDGYARQP